MFTACLLIAFVNHLVSAAPKSICFSDFNENCKESTFVDKTLFIREVLKDAGHKIVITAPQGFGKSANLHMLKSFLQLEMDKNGNEVTIIKDKTKPIKDTPNYKLFEQLKIRDDVDVMTKHFGKYPIIHVDLKAVVRLLSYNESEDFFKDVLHETFMEHAYLEKSEKLFEDERQYVKSWSSDNYTEEELGSLMPHLAKLSKYLFKHFDRTKVVILVDHYDCPVYSCILDQDTPADIFKYVVNQVQMLVTNIKDDFYIDTIYMTGILQIEESHVSNARIIKRYEFLYEHRFLPYFGLTEDEVFDILGRYTIEVNNDILEKVQHNYGGYLSFTNVTVHNVWAILRYLHKQRLDHVWAKSYDISNMNLLLKIPDVRQKMERMLKGLPVVMELKKTFSFENLFILRDLVLFPKGKEHLMYTILFFSYIYHQGFLSYDTEVKSAISDARRYIIPNEEVKEYFWKGLND